jgi:hypothetical protein
VLPMTSTLVLVPAAGEILETEQIVDLPLAGPATPTPAYNVREHLLLMILAALVIRLIVMGFLYPEQLDPYKDHWRFGYETGRVARSIVLGQGIGSPFYSYTGPTATMTPIYPAIVALIFKIFGTYTKASALVALSFNALISALTCIPIFLIARSSFGERMGIWAGWAWAFFPYGIYYPVERIWSTWLSTLLLACLFLIVLNLEHSSNWKTWLGYGLLWGFAGLNEPIVLSVLVPLSLWACYCLWRSRKPWFVPAVISGIAFVATVSPWIVRNYLVFHQVIPFRDNVGLELAVGNNGNGLHWHPKEVGPWHNPAEWEKFQRVGELNYMADEKRQALNYMKAHPGWVATQALRRVGYVWFGYWSFDPRYLVEEPLDPENVFFCTIVSAFTLIGLWFAFRQDWRTAAPYALVLFFFPLLYYFTHAEVYHRRPIDPFFLILAVYGLQRLRRPAPAREECAAEKEELVPMA